MFDFILAVWFYGQFVLMGLLLLVFLWFKVREYWRNQNALRKMLNEYYDSSKSEHG